MYSIKEELCLAACASFRGERASLLGEESRSDYLLVNRSALHLGVFISSFWDVSATSC